MGKFQFAGVGEEVLKYSRHLRHFIWRFVPLYFSSGIGLRPMPLKKLPRWEDFYEGIGIIRYFPGTVYLQKQ